VIKKGLYMKKNNEEFLLLSTEQFLGLLESILSVEEFLREEGFYKAKKTIPVFLEKLHKDSALSVVDIGIFVLMYGLLCERDRIGDTDFVEKFEKALENKNNIDLDNFEFNLKDILSLFLKAENEINSAFLNKDYEIDLDIFIELLSILFYLDYMKFLERKNKP
jgi:hypothetical protein